MNATVQVMKFMADQITRLIDLQKTQAEQQQQMLKTSLESQGPKKSWDNVEKFKNIKQFSGKAKDWEEFATKFRSQAGANDIYVAGVLDMIENDMKEGELEDLKDSTDYGVIATDKYPEEMLYGTSQKLYNVLWSITTGEANAVVRRCRGNVL